MLLEIVYCVVGYLGIFALSGALGKWAINAGISGPEPRAKRIAICWRLVEVFAAATELVVLWSFLVIRGGLGLIVAVLFTIVVGGTYVIGSLFAAVTVPFGSQIAYFASIRAKLDS